MKPSLDDLDRPFRARLQDVIGDLRAEGIELRLTTGLRPPAEQARLWRQSRSREEIEAAIRHLKQAGAYYLAEVLEAAGPCHGPPVTRALPGLSWHQWGEAADFVWIVDGVAEWSPTRIVNRDNGYLALARAAEAGGLEPGGRWTRLPDWPHVQKRGAPSPLAAGMALAVIDREMRARFDAADGA